MSRHLDAVATSTLIQEQSRHQIQRKEVATRSSCRDISSTKDMSQPNKGFCDKDKDNTGRDKDSMSRQYQRTGPVNLKSTKKCIEIRAQLQNPINTQLLLKKRSSWRLKREIWIAEGSCILIFLFFSFIFFSFYFRLV